MAFFSLIRQRDSMDCGPACLMMICRHFGAVFSIERVRRIAAKSRSGTTLFGIAKAAEALGFRTLPLRLDFATLCRQATLPCIAHLTAGHYVVVYRITRRRIFVADPDQGKLSYRHAEFEKLWTNAESGQGIAMMLQPSESFQTQEEQEHEERATGLRTLLPRILQFRPYLVQLLLGVGVATAINVSLPFATQALVDHGLNANDLSFVYLVIFAQAVLLLSRTALEFLRSWILLHIGTRINVSVIAEFLHKLIRLPLSYFDGKGVGDILQRIGDHSRIEHFLTARTLDTLFSLVNLVLFGALLALFSVKIFLAFVAGTTLAVGWMILFLNQRRRIDHQIFKVASENQSSLVEIIDGMPDIKLNQCAWQKRWGWEEIQARLFKLKIKHLAVEQYQKAGTVLFNELKNLAITFIAAYLVIRGQLTLGSYVAVAYILGQLSAPVMQLVEFFKSAQDANLSLLRIGEVQRLPEEEDAQRVITDIPKDAALQISGLVFAYPGYDPVLRDIHLAIAARQTTAIVGASGSGKTTLMKLLLQFYWPDHGQILLGDRDLSRISPEAWRAKCGVVQQNGFLFSDTIAGNIVMQGQMDEARLEHALQVANLLDDIQRLPHGWHTVVGPSGLSLSQGQQQRLQIARAVYRQPEYLFFDEATSALDANNEKAIQNHLNFFFEGRTVVIIAHRLSTVRHADQIVVLDRGQVVEQGGHDELSSQRGHYYHLVKNQLELGT